MTDAADKGNLSADEPVQENNGEDGEDDEDGGDEEDGGHGEDGAEDEEEVHDDASD